MNKFMGKTTKDEIKIILNRKLYEEKVIDYNMYNFISNKLNKKTQYIKINETRGDKSHI